MTIKTITSNELKKGNQIVLKNGWKATIEDNKKGNIRMAMVHGFCSELGSIYVHDIGYAIVNGERHLIELTDSQKKCKAMVDNMF